MYRERERERERERVDFSKINTLCGRILYVEMIKLFFFSFYFVVSCDGAFYLP